MKLFEFPIRPTSGFGTPLKGDTLFGHFCWQAACDASLLDGGLPGWISCYGAKPFAVFSSAWPRFRADKIRYAMKRPDLPLRLLFPAGAGESKKEVLARLKEDSERKWMLVDRDPSLSLQGAEFVTENRLAEMAEKDLSPAAKKDLGGRRPASFFFHFTQPHNSINRLTTTTGEAPFAPFSESCTFFYPETELAVFVLIDSSATDAEKVRVALERVGACGYGRDASTGKGRFEVAEPVELPLPGQVSADACYTLAPCVPKAGAFSKSFFTPFIRFGKHGDRLARAANPFKKPVLMADEGAVFKSGDSATFEKPYIGRAVSGVSVADPNAVVQGYTIYLPFRIGDLI